MKKEYGKVMDDYFKIYPVTEPGVYTSALLNPEAMREFYSYVLEHPRHCIRKGLAVPLPPQSLQVILTGFTCVGGRTTPYLQTTQEFEYTSKAFENAYAALHVRFFKATLRPTAIR